MTTKFKAIFIEIPPEPRVVRHTAYENTMRKLTKQWDDEKSRLLEAEQWRLIQNWSKE